MITVKRGSRGPQVQKLQLALNAARQYGLTKDGIFGVSTEEAVRDFQRVNGLTVDGVVGAKTWSKLGYETADEATPGGRTIRKLIIHCSATPEGENYTSDAIDLWHKIRSFSYYTDPDTKKKRYIGYHYVVLRDGTIEVCRPENVRGCHVSNHNVDSIGICYIGGCPPRTVQDWMYLARDTRTPEQKRAMRELLKDLKRRYPDAVIYGHRDFANKACPGFDAKAEYKNL